MLKTPRAMLSKSTLVLEASRLRVSVWSLKPKIQNAELLTVSVTIVTIQDQDGKPTIGVVKSGNMIKLKPILDELEIKAKSSLANGQNQAVLPFKLDPSKVIKVPLKNTIDLDMYEIMSKHEDIFPKVYKITPQYVIIEKVNSKVAIDQINWLLEKFYDESPHGRFDGHFTSTNEITLDFDGYMDSNHGIFGSDNGYGSEYPSLILILNHLYEQYGLGPEWDSFIDESFYENQIPIIKRFVDVIDKAHKYTGKKTLDIHDKQFGYDTTGKLKLLDF
jgi:hypothetical protein